LGLAVDDFCGDLPVPVASGSAGPAALEGDDIEGADVVRKTGGCAEPVEEDDVVRVMAGGCARKEPRLDATAPRLDRPEGAPVVVGVVLELAAGLALTVGVIMVPVTGVSLALAVGVGPADASALLSIAARIGLLRST